MTLETFVLGLAAGYIVWLLYRTVSKRQSLPTDKIRLVSKETGEVLEMQIVQTGTPKNKNVWDDNAFLTAAKWAFQKTLSAFASCDLRTLKDGLAPDVYKAFEQDIVSRKLKKQKMDFSLICFDAAEIVHKNPSNDEVTVRFQTEQINLLKDENGNVIEGDKMNIALMTDTWIFKKVGKESWVITSTQSRMSPCAK